MGDGPIFLLMIVSIINIGVAILGILLATGVIH